MKRTTQCSRAFSSGRTTFLRWRMFLIAFYNSNSIHNSFFSLFSSIFFTNHVRLKQEYENYNGTKLVISIDLYSNNVLIWSWNLTKNWYHLTWHLQLYNSKCFPKYLVSKQNNFTSLFLIFQNFQWRYSNKKRTWYIEYSIGVCRSKNACRSFWKNNCGCLSEWWNLFDRMEKLLKK